MTRMGRIRADWDGGERSKNSLRTERMEIRLSERAGPSVCQSISLGDERWWNARVRWWQQPQSGPSKKGKDRPPARAPCQWWVKNGFAQKIRLKVSHRISKLGKLIFIVASPYGCGAPGIPGTN